MRSMHACARTITESWRDAKNDPNEHDPQTRSYRCVVHLGYAISVPVYSMCHYSTSCACTGTQDSFKGDNYASTKCIKQSNSRDCNFICNIYLYLSSILDPCCACTGTGTGTVPVQYCQVLQFTVSLLKCFCRRS